MENFEKKQAEEEIYQRISKRILDSVKGEKAYSRQEVLTEFVEDNSPRIEKQKITYGQNWKKYNSYQIDEKLLFLELMCSLVDHFDISKENSVGRPPVDIKDMIKYGLMKTYSTFSCRRMMGDIQMCFNNNLIENKYHFGTLSNYMKKDQFKDILHHFLEYSALPMSKSEVCFAVDSSGFTCKKFRRWSEDKFTYKTNKIRDYKKAHVISGTRTNIIASAIITPFNGADSPQFKKLIGNIKNKFTIVEVYADKAYSSRENLQLIKSLGGTAYIPFKSNTRGNSKGCQEWSDLFKLMKENPEFFYSKYHRRSKVENVFSQVKMKFLDYIRSKNPIAQESEILLKLICHNLSVLIREMKEL